MKKSFSSRRKWERSLSLLPALTLIAFLLFSEPPFVFILFLSAAAFHEWGHLCAFRAVGLSAPAFYVQGAGVRLATQIPMLRWQEGIVCAAGPFFNFLFALCILRFGKNDFFVLCAVVHLLFAFGNLLPFGNSDGERLLRLFFTRFFSKNAESILTFFRTAVLAIFFFFSLFVYYLTGNALCGVLFSLFFLLFDEKA